MPERAFVTASLDQLTSADPKCLGIIPLLEQALRSGSPHTLRNNHTGFLTQTDILTSSDMRRLYLQARYEAYLRAQALNPADPGTAAVQAQWTNPYLERTRVTRTRYTYS